jgi:putative FmdB family regulatory protein
MPLYEYECDSCHHRFERIRKFSDPPLTTCPNCGGPVRKLLSSPAIQFKGSGWYITDYARQGSEKKTEQTQDTGKPSGETPAKTEAAKSSTSESSAPASKPSGDTTPAKSS